MAEIIGLLIVWEVVGEDNVNINEVYWFSLKYWGLNDGGEVILGRCNGESYVIVVE